MEVPKRLGRDLQAMMHQDMRDLGIFYTYDDADVRKGTALLFGPEGTPYANCPLVFSVSIPMDYPFNSPSVQILTSDGATRFHPNLYIQGKVCLSILGTYSGPKWASTMSLETIFKSIHSLLNENPITNEPGWETYTLDHPQARAYRNWVTFRLAAHTVEQARQWVQNRSGDHLWSPFEEDAKEALERNLAAVWKRIEGAAAAHPEPVRHASIPYGMSGTIDWPALAARARTLAPGKLEG